MYPRPWATRVFISKGSAATGNSVDTALVTDDSSCAFFLKSGVRAGAIPNTPGPSAGDRGSGVARRFEVFRGEIRGFSEPRLTSAVVPLAEARMILRSCIRQRIFMRTYSGWTGSWAGFPTARLALALMRLVAGGNTMPTPRGPNRLEGSLSSGACRSPFTGIRTAWR